MIVSTYTLPVYWASALLNRDYSDLTNGEVADIKGWLKMANVGEAMEMSEQRDYKNFMGQGCEVAEYTFFK